MNKAELIENLSIKIGTGKAETARMVDALIEIITTALAGGEAVTVYGFGGLEVKPRAPRTARNPITGAQVHVSARRAVVFRSGAALKRAMQKE